MSKGDQSWDMLFVDDAVEAMINTAQSSNINGEIINIGSGQPVSIKAIGNEILRITQSSTKLKIGALAQSKGSIPNLVCNVDKAKQLLNWKSKTSLEDGLLKTIDWYRLHRHRFLQGSDHA